MKAKIIFATLVFLGSTLADTNSVAEPVITQFEVDGNTYPLYSYPVYSIAFSQNLDTDKVEEMSWEAPPSGYSTHIEYRIDFGPSGNSAGYSDTAWTNYDNHPYYVTTDDLSYTVGPIGYTNLPNTYYDSPSRFYDENEYAKLFLRVRYESFGTNTPWKYLQPIWVYYND